MESGKQEPLPSVSCTLADFLCAYSGAAKCRPVSAHCTALLSLAFLLAT